jgi:hypothetical protein
VSGNEAWEYRLRMIKEWNGMGMDVMRLLVVVVVACELAGWQMAELIWSPAIRTRFTGHPSKPRSQLLISRSLSLSFLHPTHYPRRAARRRSRMETRLTLPPHLLETIKQLVIADVELPSGLRRDLDTAVSSATVVAVEAQRAVPDTERERERTDDNSKSDHPEGSEALGGAKEVVPPTIDVEVLEQLSKWATSNDGRALLNRKRLGADCLDRLCRTIVADLARSLKLPTHIPTCWDGGVSPPISA